MVDMYTDTNFSVLKNFLKENSQFLNEFEKVASEDEVIPKGELSPEAFADPVCRMFPIYTKTAAYNSALYALAQADEVPFEIKQNIQDACEVFGIDIDVVGYEKIASDNNINIELSDNDFIFPNSKKLPVVDEETYTLSKEAFIKVAHELAPESVIYGARRFISKAQEIGITPDKDIVKMAMAYGVNRQALIDEAKDLFLSTGDKEAQAVAELAKTASFEELSNLGLKLVKIASKHRGELGLQKLASITYDEKIEFLKFGPFEIELDKVASIPEDEWTEVLTNEEINSFYKEAEFDKIAFVETFKRLSPIEQDAVIGFIQKYY